MEFAGHPEPPVEVKIGVDHGADLSLVDGLSGWQTTLVTFGAIAAVVFCGNFMTGPVFRFIAQARLRELFTATALSMVIGIALLMSLVGLSPALGTFLAGVVLANSEYRHELESDIEPFKGLLLGLFFMTVGAGINLGLLIGSFGTIAAMTLALVAVKVAVLLVLARIFKIEGSERWLFALGLAQAGEFGFVMVSFSIANNVIPLALADQLLLVVALSMLLTPALFIFYDQVIVPRFVQEQNREADAMPEDSHIIIAGHGRIGGLIDRMLKGAGYKATVIDFSSKRLDILRKFGVHSYFGDATRPDLLHSAGISDAKLLIVAIDGREQITELVNYATQNYGDLHVMARAVDRNHVYELWAAGCRDIIRETSDSAIRMGRSAFEALGASKDEAGQMAAAYSEMDRNSMIAMAEHYDSDIPGHENEVYIAKVREMLQLGEKELGDQMNAILKDKKK